MPSIDQLQIINFRNLSEISLSLSRGVNLIYGSNGSGKTSLLEALYVLSSGKSFRSALVDPLIKDGELEAMVYVCTPENARYGLRKRRHKKALLRVNGENQKNWDQVARALPVLVIDSGAFELLEGGPKIRRRFIDWGVFHVERGFEAIWRNFSRCLKQRNQVLKQRSTAVEVWDKELCRWGEQVDHRRSRYFYEYQGVLADVCRLVMPGFRIDCSYLRGWPEDRDLLSQLETDQSRDQDRGQTHRGPHRACLLYTSPSPRDATLSRMPSSA